MDQELAQLQSLSASGDRHAQFRLGTLYRRGGGGVTRDVAMASSLYSQAGAQGHADAQFQMGLACKDGEGVAKDAVKAAVWFSHAAKQGQVKAQYQLAQACAKGHGLQQDATKAAYWYRQAAGQGHHWSLMQLGTLLWRGEGVEKNMSEARSCWAKAKALGNEKAARTLLTLAAAEQEGITIDAPWLFDAERERARAEGGDADARRTMGAAYRRGAPGCPKNPVVAAQWYRQAAEQEDPESQYQMGARVQGWVRGGEGPG